MTSFASLTIGRGLQRTLVLAALVIGAESAYACGDCDGNSEVTVDEIVTLVTAALMGGDGDCPNGDADASGDITVDEILIAVNSALGGCPDDFPTPTPTPTAPPDSCGNGVVELAEDCDDGGVCAGGESSGASCDSESVCLGTLGACVGGANNLRGCGTTVAGACPDGVCLKCRPQGGDGCAQNCTNETRIPFPFKPGTIDGIVIRDGSGATVYGPVISVALPFFEGSQVLTVGRSRAGGPIPVVIKANDFILPRIPVQVIACACVRGASAMSCGGTVFDEAGALSPNCTPGFEMQNSCPPNRPCALVHGVGNTASGFIGCSGDSKEYGLDVLQDCNGQEGELPFDPVATVTANGSGAGAAYLINSVAIGTVVGGCTGTAADYGPDGNFCTADDNPSTFGTPNPIPLTTGMATGQVDNPANFEGDHNGPWSTSGARFQCSDGDLTTACGANLAGVFTSCDQPTINDIVVPNNFEAPPCN